MRETTRLEVVHDGAQWSITEHGIGRLSSYPTKLVAAAAGHALARLHTPSKLVIRNVNGTIDTEHTYDRPAKATQG
ncbi:MAG: DUF2188 domain-containing protein [Gemmatimonadota bacterium]